MDFLTYINKAVTPYQAIDTLREYLKEKGYTELDAGSIWSLKQGGRYYTVPFGTSIYAFNIGDHYRERGALRIGGGHTDYPCLRIKPNPEMIEADYMRLDVETYGGLIVSSWLDRPLSIAGRVMLKSDDAFDPIAVNVDFARPLLTIPNLAIHLNRDINKGYEYNKQTELLPIIGLLSEKFSRDNYLLELLAGELNGGKYGFNYRIDVDNILDFDLYVYDCEDAVFLGAENEFISAPRLDDQTSCYGLITALADSENADKISLVALYDNEEVGSLSKQGADSLTVNYILEKIYAGLGFETSALRDAMFKSMMLSADVAQGYHPNFSAKYDPKNHCICGNGVAIKTNYSQKYATDTEALAIVKRLCQVYGIEYQTYANRSDIAGGGTIASIASSHLPMKTVDLGVPILAMHSAREFMGAKDQVYLYQLAKAFFEN